MREVAVCLLPCVCRIRNTLFESTHGCLTLKEIQRLLYEQYLHRCSQHEKSVPFCIEEAQDFLQRAAPALSSDSMQYLSILQFT
jgi:hypothetical protein